MIVLTDPATLPPGDRPVSLAIGVFDGIHLGHQQIILQTVHDARANHTRPLVITFDRHPNAIVAPDRTPPRLANRNQKLRAIAALGIHATIEIPFTPEFSRQTGEAFIRSLARDLGPLRSISVGADFVFGHRRGGNVTLLQKLGAELGFHVHGLAAVLQDGRPVSSTRIREAVRTADLPQAARLLGHPFTLAGPVIHGDHLGRQLGFPTANLAVNELALPPNGVYSARARLGDKTHRAALNIGLRPTLTNPQPELRLEAHLLDFQGDIYGQELELEPLLRLRPEQRFNSLAELRDQISRDIDAVRTTPLP